MPSARATAQGMLYFHWTMTPIHVPINQGIAMAVAIHFALSVESLSTKVFVK